MSSCWNLTIKISDAKSLIYCCEFISQRSPNASTSSREVNPSSTWLHLVWLKQPSFSGAWIRKKNTKATMNTRCCTALIKPRVIYWFLAFPPRPAMALGVNKELRDTISITVHKASGSKRKKIISLWRIRITSSLIFVYKRGVVAIRPGFSPHARESDGSHSALSACQITIAI